MSDKPPKRLFVLLADSGYHHHVGRIFGVVRVCTHGSETKSILSERKVYSTTVKGVAEKSEHDGRGIAQIQTGLIRTPQYKRLACAQLDQLVADACADRGRRPH